MPDNTFDVVSEINMPEVSNAIQQAMKEIGTRYDLKDSKSSIELKEKDKKLELASSDDFKLKAVIEILQGKLVKRGVPIKNLTYGPVTSSAGSSVKQEVTLNQFNVGQQGPLTVFNLLVEADGTLWGAQGSQGSDGLRSKSARAVVTGQHC